VVSVHLVLSLRVRGQLAQSEAQGLCPPGAECEVSGQLAESEGQW